MNHAIASNHRLENCQALDRLYCSSATFWPADQEGTFWVKVIDYTMIYPSCSETRYHGLCVNPMNLQGKNTKWKRSALIAEYF